MYEHLQASYGPCHDCYTFANKPNFMPKVDMKADITCEHCEHCGTPSYIDPYATCLSTNERVQFNPKQEEHMSMDRCCCDCVHENVSMYDEPCDTCRNSQHHPSFISKINNETDKPSLEEELYPRHIESNDPLHPGHYPFVGSEDPIDVCLKWGIGFCEGNVIKYVVRWKKKGGIEDLKKARIYLDRLIEHHENNIEKEA